MKLLWQYLKDYKKQLIIGPIFKLTEAILEILVPTIMAKQLIDVGIAGGDKAYIYKIGLLMLALAVVGLGCALVCQYSASVASQGFGTNLRKAAFSKICALSFADADKFGASSLLNRITGDINLLQQSVAMLIRLVIRAPFIVLGSFVMASLINWKLGLIILATAPIFALIIWLIMRKSIPLYRIIQKKLDALAATALESFGGVRIVRAFAKQRRERQRFEEATDNYARLSIFVGKISAILNPATLLVLNFLIISVLWAGGLQINAGSMTKGDIIAVTTYISYIMTAMLVVADLIILFIRAGVAKNRVVELLETVPSVAENGSETEVVESNTTIAFRDVSFSYTGTVNALENISFSLQRGESLGIIGGIGSGKSTLAYLLARFYDTGSGEVELFSKNVKDYSAPALRATIALAMQKPYIFSGTVRENILQGKPDATQAQLQRAAQIAQATEFIEQLEGGFDAPTQAQGANLSGGQRQRLSLARAIIAEAPILVLDDSSSALDYATDLKLRKALKTEYNGTLVVISQRISAIRDCSKILVLDDGRQVGFDTHENLLQSNAVYREIAASQSKKEVS